MLDIATNCNIFVFVTTCIYRYIHATALYYVCRYISLSFRLFFNAPPIQVLFNCLIISLIVHARLQLHSCQLKLRSIPTPVLIIYQV